MRGLVLGVTAMLAGTAAAGAQAPVERINIKLASFRYTPRTITLHSGQHYTLRLTNEADGAHDFSANAFFANAKVDAASAKLVKDGTVSLGGGASADVGLVPLKRGRYPVHCTHFMHSALGMNGMIIID